MNPSAGDIIAEKYRLDELIGQGGFAVVFRATDTRIDREVAVKLLSSPQDDAVANVTRFAREARSVAALTDEHTVRMFDFGRTDDGLLFMVFELLGGEDLSDLLAADGPLDEATTTHIMRQVLMSLREAHSASVLHRDIKPSNIRVYEYMDDPHCVKVMDFGIARSLDSGAIRITQTGQPVGTPRYMSPEQLMGAKLTPASDIYSLGLVVHEMLTLSERAPVEEILAGHKIDVPTSPKFARILNRMLLQDARARFQSVDALLAKLDATEEPRAPHPFEARSQDTTLVEEDAPEPHRSRRAIWAIALVSVLVFGVGLMLMVTRDAAPPSQPTQLKDVLRPSRAAPTPAALSRPDAAQLVPDDGCGVAPRALGDLDVQRTSGLEQLAWVSYVPRSYDPNERHPLVIVFPAVGVSPRGFLNETELRKLADREHIVLIVPPPRLWNVDLDPEPYVAMIEHTRDTMCIDPARIFAIGHGVGGYVAEALSCSPWMQAVATTAYRPPENRFNCDPLRETPRIMLAPMDSPLLPLHGGRNCGNFPVNSVEVFEAIWLERNACDKEPSITKIGESSCRRWECGAPVTSCYTEGGFGWPNAVPRATDLMQCDGVPGKFPYGDTIWDFFQEVSGLAH